MFWHLPTSDTCRGLVEFVEKVDADPVNIAALFMPVLMKTSVVVVSVFMHMNVGMSCSLVARTTVVPTIQLVPLTLGENIAAKARLDALTRGWVP